MPIFRRFVEDLLPLVPTIWRRKADNLFNITFNVFDQAMDSVAEALSEYIEAWPIDTAPGWLLDSHWGPYHISSIMSRMSVRSSPTPDAWCTLGSLFNAANVSASGFFIPPS